MSRIPRSGGPPRVLLMTSWRLIPPLEVSCEFPGDNLVRLDDVKVDNHDFRQAGFDVIRTRRSILVSDQPDEFAGGAHSGSSLESGQGGAANLLIQF